VLLIANAPTMQNVRMTGIKTRRGTFSTCLYVLMASTPKGNISRFAMKNTMNTA
jgi:hypothetical protein